MGRPRSRSERASERLNVENTLAWVRTAAPAPDMVSARLAEGEPRTVARLLAQWVDLVPEPETVLSRSDARDWVWAAIESVWAGNAETSAMRPASMRWLALGTLHPSRRGMTLGQAARVAVFVEGLRGRSGDQLELLSLLVDAFHDPSIRSRTERFGGWLHILTDAAEKLFREGHRARAYELLTEAWSYRGDLPPTLWSAKAAAHIASHSAHIASHLRGDSARQRFDDSVDRLRESESGLDRFVRDGGDGDGTVEYLRIGLAHENLLQHAARTLVVPYLDSVEEGYAVLTHALDRYRDLTGLPDLESLARGDAKLTREHEAHANELVKMVLRLSDCAIRSGLWETGALTLAAVERFQSNRLQEWDHAVSLAIAHPAREHRHAQLERILRLAEDAHEISPRQHSRLLARSAHAARQHAAGLHREKLHTSAEFWRSVAQEWAAGANIRDHELRDRIVSPANALSESSEVVAVEGEAPPPDPAPRTAIAKLAGPGMDDIRQKILAGIPVPVILTLSAVGSALSSPRAVVPRDNLDATVEALEGWDRPKRMRLVKPIPQDDADVGVVQQWILLSAIELAGMYARHLVPELHRTLARSPHLDPRTRLAHARQCADSAVAVGRPNFVLSGLFEAVRTALVLDDPEALATQMDDLVGAVREGQTVSRSASDLLESAYWASRRVDKIADLLMRSGHGGHVARLLDASAGWLQTSFAQQPMLAAELQLLERAKEPGNKGTQAELFAHIRGRILAKSPVVAVPRPQHAADHGQPRLAQREAFVRLVAGWDRSWAVGTVDEPDGQRDFLVELPISRAGVQELSDLIWYELRPTRMGKRVNSLRELHDAVIGPMLDELGDARSLRFSLNGVMSALPLHAAQGHDGYLLERFPVSYQTTFADEGDADGAGADLLVCGWDVAAHAEREARDVARILRRRGHRVNVPRNAIEGRRELLDDELPAAMVHVSGHGQSIAWPRSFQSKLALSSRIEITASEWLVSGRRADFVFLNVCGVGRILPHGGDLNGFPLALRIRGARAMITATGYVPPTLAHVFAERFYAAWEQGDSLSAYSRTVRELISDATPACGWVPYAHFGRGHEVAAPTVSPAPVRAGARRRGRP